MKMIFRFPHKGSPPGRTHDMDLLDNEAQAIEEVESFARLHGLGGLEILELDPDPLTSEGNTDGSPSTQEDPSTL